jgi:TRAP-type C4-dicarboxylate transport system substrate-binding protein
MTQTTTTRRTFLQAASAACLAAPQLASAQTITLSASSWSPPTSFVPTLVEAWGRDVEAATQGRVKVRLLPKPVTNVPGHYDAVKNGLADVSFVICGLTPGRFVMPKAVELPFAGSSAERVSVAFQQMHEKHFARVNEMAGVKVLAMFTTGPGAVYSRSKPITSVADIQGMKLRVAAGTLYDLGKSLGANVTVKPVTEVYELLSGGVLDGAFATIESAESFRLDRVAKFATVFPEGFSNIAWSMLMNESAWNRISKEDQAAIDRVSGARLARIWGKAWDEADRRGLAYMQAGQVKVTQASPAFIAEIKSRTRAMDEAWIKEAQDKGLPNAAAVLGELRRIVRT